MITVKNFLSVLALAVFISSCSASMLVNESFDRNTTHMAVKGRSGGVAGQRLNFGNYYTSKIDRKMFSNQESAYAMSANSMIDTMLFVLYDSAGNSSKVFCSGTSSQLELPVLGEKYKVTVGGRNMIAGTIELDTSGGTWTFVINNPNFIAPELPSEGAISNGEVAIDIKDVRRNASNRMQDRILGYEFWIGKRVIGAVELVGNGEIWIKNSLPESVKFLVASTSATLLFRYDMSKAAIIQ